MRLTALAIPWLLFLATTTAARAQETQADWQYGTVNQRDSRQYIAAIRSRNLLAGSGTIEDYPAILTIACTEGDPDHWQQQLTLDEPLTSRGIITIWASLDGGEASDQSWVVTGTKRTATHVGLPEIIRLGRAQKLELSWNWGWSWLWLSDSAMFELGDVHTVLFTLAKSCSVPVPQ